MRPIELTAATEKVVVAGNRRKYVQLGRPLRFMVVPQVHGSRLQFTMQVLFQRQACMKPKQTGRFYTPREVFRLN